MAMSVEKVGVYRQYLLTGEFVRGVLRFMPGA